MSAVRVGKEVAIYDRCASPLVRFLQGSYEKHTFPFLLKKDCVDLLSGLFVITPVQLHLFRTRLCCHSKMAQMVICGVLDQFFGSPAV